MDSYNREISRSGGIEIHCKGGPVRAGRSGALAEVIFIIDTTGSMEDEIRGLMQTCRRFTGALSGMGLDCRVGILCFGDLTIQPPDRMVALQPTANMERISNAFGEVLVKYRTNGGGNLGESSIDALFRAMEMLDGGQPAVRVFILLTDEPPLEPDTRQRTMREAISGCVQKGITCFAVTVPDHRFRALASQTGGEWFMISAGVDFLGILNGLFPRVLEHIETAALQLPPASGGGRIAGRKGG